MPDKDIGLQGTGIHIGNSHQHIPKSGVSDFCDFLFGEQPKLEKARSCWDGKGLPASAISDPATQMMKETQRG